MGATEYEPVTQRGPGFVTASVVDPVRKHPGRDVQPALPGGAGVEAVLTFPDAVGWEAWLAAHHDQARGVWVKVAKRFGTRIDHGGGGGGRWRYVTAGSTACVDPASGDFFLQRDSRRKPNSSWSRVNTDRARTSRSATRPSHLT